VHIAKVQLEGGCYIFSYRGATHAGKLDVAMSASGERMPEIINSCLPGHDFSAERAHAVGAALT
jgi:hypothetical protein